MGQNNHQKVAKMAKNANRSLAPCSEARRSVVTSTYLFLKWSNFQWVYWRCWANCQRILRMSESRRSSRSHQMLRDRSLLQTWTHRLCFGSGFENSNDHFIMRDYFLCPHRSCYNCLLFCSSMPIVWHMFRILGQGSEQYRWVLL